MNINKLAQTATEYLIILAVVIIIALIVVSVMGGIPGIGGGAGSSANSAFWQTAKVGIDSVSMVATENDTIVFKNNIPNSITVQGVWINETTASRDASASILDSAKNEQGLDSFTLAAGETKTLTGDFISCTAGETVTFYATIEYKDLDTSAIYNYSAQNNGYQTPCAESNI